MCHKWITNRNLELAVVTSHQSITPNWPGIRVFQVIRNIAQLPYSSLCFTLGWASLTVVTHMTLLVFVNLNFFFSISCFQRLVPLESKVQPTIHVANMWWTVHFYQLLLRTGLSYRNMVYPMSWKIAHVFGHWSTAGLEWSLKSKDFCIWDSRIILKG